MQFIERIIATIKLKRKINTIIKNNVNPRKSKETIFVQCNNVKLKIESERCPGFQMINVFLDENYKVRLSRTDCRRSNKKLNISLNKKLKGQYVSILESMTPSKEEKPSLSSRLILNK